MFCGQLMFFDESFNIITAPRFKKASEEDKTATLPTDVVRKDFACFHTFVIMNLVNMINCRIVADDLTDPFEIFRKYSNDGFFVPDHWLFWIVWVGELLVQHLFVIAGNFKDVPLLNVLPDLFGSVDLNWKIHLTAWMFGLFPIVVRMLSNKL